MKVVSIQSARRSVHSDAHKTAAYATQLDRIQKRKGRTINKCSKNKMTTISLIGLVVN